MGFSDNEFDRFNFSNFYEKQMERIRDELETFPIFYYKYDFDLGKTRYWIIGQDEELTEREMDEWSSIGRGGFMIKKWEKDILT